jgi:hypothetical protein
MKPRSFGVADATLLIVAVATATGLIVNRGDWARFRARWLAPVDAHDSIEHILDLLAPYLAAMTLATLAMRMRSPRPRFRRIARQPGSVACMVALAVLLLIASWIAVTISAGRVVKFTQHAIPLIPRVHDRGDVGYPAYPFGGRVLLVWGDRVGFAVAGAWLALILVGRWQSEPTWIDRLGRTIGCLWIALAVVLWLRCYSV